MSVHSVYPKNFATRNVSWPQNIPNCVCDLGSAPDLAGVLTAHPRYPLAGLGKGGEGKGEEVKGGEGRGGDKREGKGGKKTQTRSLSTALLIGN